MQRHARGEAFADGDRFTSGTRTGNYPGTQPKVCWEEPGSALPRDCLFSWLKEKEQWDFFLKEADSPPPSKTQSGGGTTKALGMARLKAQASLEV